MNTIYALDWLGGMALRGGIILVLVLGLGVACRRLSAAKRYGLWLAALLATLVLPVAMICGPAWRVLPRMERAASMPAQREPGIETEQTALWPEAQLAQPAMIAPQPMGFEVRPSAEPVPVAVEPTTFWDGRVLFWFWMGGVMTGLARLGRSALHLRKLAARKTNVSDAVRTHIDAAAAAVGLGRLPRVVVGEADATPMVWGVWTNYLLLPPDFEDWQETKLRAVLLHEFSHLARRDPLALWLGQVAQLLRWFDPLALLTLRRLRADQERACDDAVLRHGVPASDYATCLLAFSTKKAPSSDAFLCSLAMARAGSLQERLMAILDKSLSRSGAVRGWWPAAAVLGTALALPLALIHAAESSKPRGSIVDRNGVVLAETLPDGRRVYPQKELAAHVVGVASRGDTALEGRLGIEESQNTGLNEGRQVMLTLDAGLQRFAERELAVFGHQGAVVAIDLKSGGLLVLASSSGFDPNAVAASGPEWTPLDQKFSSRAIQKEYTPGSGMMLCTAMATLRAGCENTAIHCESSVLIDGRTFQSWNKSDVGEFNLEEALVKAQFVYFYEMARKLGGEPLARMAANLGLGGKTGVQLPGEAKGRFLEAAMGDKKTASSGPVISNAQLANMAIGYGPIRATPLQMAQMASVIATRGNALKPVVVAGERGEKLPDPGLSKEQWGLLHRVMRCEATGANRAGFSPVVSIAMKNSRIQGESPVEAVIGFAPVENPSIAFAVLFEGKPGDDVLSVEAAPMAKRMMERVIEMRGE